MSVATPSNLQTQLLRTYWDTRLYNESMFQDIFSRYRTILDRTTNISIPMDSLTLEVNAEINNGYRNGRLGFINALQGTPREGNAQQQLGFEETLREKSMEIYYNEFSHAFSLFNYGIEYNDQSAYGINMDKGTQLLANYMEELAGLYYRQALLQQYARNLTQQPHNLTQLWSHRWYIKNISDTAQPAYNTTLQTHTDNIANALISAGTGINATLDARYLTALHHRITMDRIEPIRVSGTDAYILTVPSSQKFHVLDLDRTDSPGTYWTSVNRMSDEDKINFPGLLGKWINIYLVEDVRYPTLTISGSASPFTLTAGYVHPGNNDERDFGSGARDVGFLLGRAPLIDWYPTKIHHEFDDYNYRKLQGKGAFGERGVQIRSYDDPTPTNTSWEQRYYITCVWARNNITN